MSSSPFGAVSVAATLVVLILPVAGPALASEPQLTLSPSHGAIGTHVSIRGTIPPGDIENWRNQWRSPAYFALIRDFAASPRFNGNACELIGEAVDGSVRLDRTTGKVTGAFRVPATGTCFQSGDDASHRLTPGTYNVAIGCHACFVASFTVTAALARTGSPVAGISIAGALLVLIGAALRFTVVAPMSRGGVERL